MNAKRAKKDERAEQALTFEQALENLEQIVHELEQGDLTLGEALARYERGIRCVKLCHEQLHLAERRIELLSGFDAEGNEIREPFDDPDAELPEKAASRSKRRTHKRG